MPEYEFNYRYTERNSLTLNAKNLKTARELFKEKMIGTQDLRVESIETGRTKFESKVFEKTREALEDFPLSELELSTRAMNCLTNKEYIVISDIWDMTEGELIGRCSNLGRMTMREIIDRLKDLGVYRQC